jgi:hypothetical protein
MTDLRKFETGATRDVDHHKFDYEAFLSPYVLERYAEYMHEKRKMPDGSLRDGDNWQKGIPLDAYMKSGFRHFIDWWALHRDTKGVAIEDLETSLLALLFNVHGYLHEVVKVRKEQNAPTKNLNS